MWAMGITAAATIAPVIAVTVIVATDACIVDAIVTDIAMGHGTVIGAGVMAIVIGFVTATGTAIDKPVTGPTRIRMNADKLLCLFGVDQIVDLQVINLKIV